MCGSGNDAHVTLGKKETGARAALPIWLEFMQQAMQGMPVEDFPNVVRLEKLAETQKVQVDTPDTAPPADVAEQGLAATPASHTATPKPNPPPNPTTPVPIPSQ